MGQDITEEELQAQQEKLWRAKREAAEEKVAALVQELADDGLAVRITHRIEVVPLQRR